MRIEVAKALEGAIPGLAARQIIDSAIRPAFRADDYAGGLNLALDGLMQRVQGEGLPAPSSGEGARSGAKPGLQLEELGMFFFLAVPVLGALLSRLFGRKFGRKFSSLLSAGAVGGLGWWFTASVLMAVGAGLVTLLLVGVLGIGAALRGANSRGGGLPHIGGWGGGFSSGGGGDFGQPRRPALRV